jgi:hypothetical protein
LQEDETKANKRKKAIINRGENFFIHFLGFMVTNIITVLLILNKKGFLPAIP